MDSPKHRDEALALLTDATSEVASDPWWRVVAPHEKLDKLMPYPDEMVPGGLAAISDV